jgi:hypothetical protein
LCFLTLTTFFPPEASSELAVPTNLGVLRDSIITRLSSGKRRSSDGGINLSGNSPQEHPRERSAHYRPSSRTATLNAPASPSLPSSHRSSPRTPSPRVAHISSRLASPRLEDRTSSRTLNVTQQSHASNLKKSTLSISSDRLNVATNPNELESPVALIRQAPKPSHSRSSSFGASSIVVEEPMPLSERPPSNASIVSPTREPLDPPSPGLDRRKANFSPNIRRRVTPKKGTFGGASRFKDLPVDFRNYGDVIGSKAKSKKHKVSFSFVLFGFPHPIVHFRSRSMRLFPFFLGPLVFAKNISRIFSAIFIARFNLL